MEKAGKTLRASAWAEVSKAPGLWIAVAGAWLAQGRGPGGGRQGEFSLSRGSGCSSPALFIHCVEQLLGPLGLV